VPVGCNSLWYKRTAHQQHCAKVFDEAKNPPEAGRLWSNPKRQASAETAPRAADYARHCAALARIERKLGY
jgi:hypothetical protein